MQADENSDGILGKNEWKRYDTRVRKNFNKFFAKCTKSGDLTMIELQSCLACNAYCPTQAEFDFMDLNQNGRVTKKEFKFSLRK